MRVKEESLICEPNTTRKKYKLQKKKNNNNNKEEKKEEKEKKKTERCLATGLHMWLGTTSI